MFTILTIKTKIKNLKILLKEYDKKKVLDSLSQEMKQTLINKIEELENLVKQKARDTTNNDNNDQHITWSLLLFYEVEENIIKLKKIKQLPQ